MRVSMMALLALPSLVDSQSPAVVEFTAVVTAEGGTADFKWTEGEDVGAAAAAFCGEHVAEEHRAACAPAIAAQVENELKVRKQLAGLAALELEVQVGEEKTVFRHRDGGDVRAEASAFCEKYVADEQVAACAAHLVEGALQAAARPKRDPLEAEEPESAWDRLLGPQLVAAGGKTVSVDAALAKKKNVALLFAADWCKPCRDFVPKLKAYYKLASRRGLEIVWVSASRSQANFDAYLQDMPWPAVPLAAAPAVMAAAAIACPNRRGTPCGSASRWREVRTAPGRTPRPTPTTTPIWAPRNPPTRKPIRMQKPVLMATAMAKAAPR